MSPFNQKKQQMAEQATFVVYFLKTGKNAT